MLVKNINFKVNMVNINDDGTEVQKGLESILSEYKINNYFHNLYNGYSDTRIKEEKIYVTEYQQQEFRGYIEECQYEGRKSYKVYIKDYKENCFHVGYVPFGKVPEIEEWIENNNLKVKGSIFILGGNAKYCDNDGNIINESGKYGLEVELRFYNSKKTKEANKVFRFIKNKIFLTIFDFLLLIGLILWLTLSKPKFEIKDFTISEKTYEYTNTVAFTGEGKIVSNNKKDKFIVLVNRKLISGGNKDSENSNSSQAIIINEGEGLFTTYDSGEENKISKPKYEFEILGYIKFK